MRFDILSLFPECFESYFNASIVKRAKERGLIEICQVDIRDFAENKHNRVDDRPYGGGPGMVLMAEPVAKAIRSCRTERSRVVALSPRGKVLDAGKCKELAGYDHLVLVCGHYEGIDQRVLDSDVHEEISVGDYVLSNGCLPAMLLVDAVIRWVPGVLGHSEASTLDSFERGGLLEGPQYTKPFEFEGQKVPEVLLSGNHKDIERWRLKEAEKITKERRPDLIERQKKS